MWLCTVAWQASGFQQQHVDSSQQASGQEGWDWVAGRSAASLLKQGFIATWNAQEWDLALAESFMFDLPVAVNWDYFVSAVQLPWTNADMPSTLLFISQKQTVVAPPGPASGCAALHPSDVSVWHMAPAGQPAAVQVLGIHS
jgi:hypothetical protein